MIDYCDLMTAVQFSVQYTEPRNRVANLSGGITVIANPNVDAVMDGVSVNVWNAKCQSENGC